MSTRTHNSTYGRRRARDSVGLSVGGDAFYTWGVARFRNTPSPSFQRNERNTKITQKSENKVERQRSGRKKNFPLLPRVTGGTESVLPVPAWPGLPERWVQGKSRVKQSTGEIRATLGAGLVSVAGVLLLGVLTQVYRITVIPLN